jgi:hypothetical protein
LLAGSCAFDVLLDGHPIHISKSAIAALMLPFLGKS